MTINAVETTETSITNLKAVLDNARMAELLFLPATPEAKALAEDALSQTLAFEATYKPRKQKIRAADLRSLRQGLGAFLGDLIAHASNEDAEGYMYRSRNRALFSKTLCSSRTYDRLRELWLAMGWVARQPGFAVREDFAGESYIAHKKAERLRATHRLLELALSFGVTPQNAKRHFLKEHQISWPIEVKTKSVRNNMGQKVSKRMRLPQVDGLEDKLEQIRNLNAFYEQHEFNLPDVPCLKRTFNNGDDPEFRYDLGGRLYCTSKAGYQSMRKAERRTITINGEPTSEVDVSGSFPFILHNALNAPLPKMDDIYEIEGIERDVVKKIVVTRMGSEDWPKRWPQDFAEEYQAATGRKLQNRYTLKKVVAAVKEHLPILDELDQRAMGWAKLQYLESEAILMAIDTLKEDYGAVALPIHDSIIVPTRFVDQAITALKEAYCSCFGSSPKVTVS